MERELEYREGIKSVAEINIRRGNKYRFNIAHGLCYNIQTISNANRRSV